MAFGQELKDFVEGFKSGEDIKDRWETQKLNRERFGKPTEADIANQPGGVGGSTAPAIPEDGGGGSADVAWNDADPTQRAFLNTLAGPESGGEYNIIYGGEHFEDYSKHPGVYKTITSGPNKGKKSSAAGKYQFLETTWNDIANRYDLKDFSPENQDKAAWYLAAETYGRTKGRSLTADLKSGDPKILASVGQALSPIWTSLPSGIEQGTTTDKFVSTFNKYLEAAPTATADASGVLPESGGQQAKAQTSFIDPATAAKMDPDIVRVTERAARDNPGLFGFNPKTKTIRTPEEQEEMVKKGWSKTRKSKHLEGKAVDLVPINPNTGQPDPDYTAGYSKISDAMRKAAEAEGVKDLKWGGDWKSFQDKPHWQVSMLEQQQQVEPGGFTTPEPEEEVRPTMFAAAGGVLPEPQRFQTGGQPVVPPVNPANPAGQPDKYSRFRNYTQQITPSTTAAPSWTPRRVGTMAPGTTAAQGLQRTDGLTPSQLAFKQANDKLAADRAAKAAADAAAAAAAAKQVQQPQRSPYVWSAYRGGPQGKETFQTFGDFFNTLKTGKAPPRVSSGSARYGSHYRGGMVGMEEGGVIPDPQDVQNFARGGQPLADRDAQFKKLLQQESRPGRDSQEARDRAAKRLSAMEKRPTSSAYKASEYWTTPKPKKGGDGGGTKVDTTKTGSTSTGKKDAWSAAVGQTPSPYETKKPDAWSAAVGQTANPYTQGARPPATGVTEPPAMGTAAQEAIDRAGPPTPIPEPVYPEDRTEREPRMPTEGEGGWRKRRVTPRPAVEAPALPPARPPVGDISTAPMRTDAQTAIDQAARPAAPAPAEPVPPQHAQMIDEARQLIASGQISPQEIGQKLEMMGLPKDLWPLDIQQAVLGFQRGGAVPEEDELLTRSPRAEAAGYTTSAGGAMARPAARPAAAAPAPGVSSETTASIPSEEERPRERMQPTPKLLSDVSKALDSGVKFLTRRFGLQEDGAVETPESGQAKQDGARRFASGEGAATQEEVDQIDDTIDPDREMTEGDRAMTRSAKIVQWYLERGRKEEAEAAAGSLLQHGAQKFSQIGSLAAAAYRKYQETGDPAHLEATTKALQKAYEYIPDGGSLGIQIDAKTKQLEVVRTNEDGEEEEIPVKPEDLPGIIQGVQNKSLYWQQVMATADPEGTRQKERIAAEEKEWTRRHKIESTEELEKEEREAERTRIKEEKEARTKKEEAEEKAAAELAKEERTNKENERRALRDAAVRRAEKLAEANPKVSWDKVNPLMGDVAEIIANEDLEDDDRKAQLDKAASRLWDSLPDDEKRAELFEKLAPDAVGFTYTAPAANAMVREGDTPPAQYKDAKPGTDKDGNPIWVVEKDGKRYAVPAS